MPEKRNFSLWTNKVVRWELQPALFIFYTEMHGDEPVEYEVKMTPYPPEGDVPDVYAPDEAGNAVSLGSLTGFVLEGIRVLNGRNEIAIRGPFSSNEWVDASFYNTDDVYAPIMDGRLWTQDDPLPISVRKARAPRQILNLTRRRGSG